MSNNAARDSRPSSPHGENTLSNWSQMDTNNKEQRGTVLNLMETVLAHPGLVYRFHHVNLSHEDPLVAVVTVGHRDGNCNGNIPVNIDFPNVAWDTTNPNAVNRSTLWQGTRLGVVSAQLRSPEGSAYRFKPVVWSEFDRARAVYAPHQLLMATLVGGQPDWINGIVPGSDEASVRGALHDAIMAGNTHCWTQHGFGVECAQSLRELLDSPGVTHPVTGEDTGRHFFVAVGRVNSGRDQPHREGNALQWRYNCSELAVIHLDPEQVSRNETFGAYAETPLDPAGRMNLVESIRAQVYPAAVAPASVAATQVEVVAPEVVAQPERTSESSTSPYWNGFGVAPSSTTHAVEPAKIIADFDSVNNYAVWCQVKEVLGITASTDPQRSAAQAVSNAVRWWLAHKAYGRPVLQEINLTSYCWTVQDIRDVVEIITAVGTGRGLESSYLPSLEGNVLQFGVGGPVFELEGELVYDYRGRMLLNTAELHVTAHRNGRNIEYRLEGIEQVSSAAQFIRLLYFGYLPLLSQSITRVMDSLAANFAEFCRHQWVDQHLVRFSRDAVREQNSAVQLRVVNSFPMTIRQPYSPLKGGTWVRLDADGKFALNLITLYDKQIQFHERDLKDIKKAAIRVAYEQGALDYRFDKQMLVSGGLGAINCRLLQATNPQFYAQLVERYGVSTNNVLVLTMKLSKGIKRALLAMAQAVGVRDAKPAGYQLRGQLSPVRGFLAQVILAPTVVAPPGMSASVGLKPVAEVVKRVANYVLHDFHETPRFDFGLGCAIKPDTFTVTQPKEGVTRFVFNQLIEIEPDQLLCQIQRSSGGFNAVVHNAPFEGELRWIEYEIVNSMTAGKTELKLNWEYVTYEEDMKARSVAKALVVGTSPELVFNDRNPSLEDCDCDIVHFQDALKVDVWWSYLMCAGTTLRYNWDNPQVAELRRLAVEINTRVGRPDFKGLLIDHVYYAVGAYDAFQQEFMRLFARPLWYQLGQVGDSDFGRMLYEMHQSADYTRVANPKAAVYMRAGDDVNSPETNFTAFVFEGNRVTEVWQRGMSFAGLPGCPLYNVELFESTTPKENVGESWQMPAELRAAQAITNNGANPEALARLTQEIQLDVLPNIAMAKALEAMHSGSDFGGHCKRIEVLAATQNNSTYYYLPPVTHRHLVSVVKELEISTSTANISEAFRKLSVRLSKVVFTFMVNGRQVSIWLPALYELNRLRSNNESGQTLSSVFYREFLMPLIENNRVDPAVVMMVRGKLKSILHSSETPKLLKGRPKVGARRIGLPCIPVGETWILYSDLPNSVYQRARRYCARFGQRLGLDINPNLIGYNSRAPLAAGWYSQLRVITPLENSSNFYQLDPYKLGVNPIATYIDGGDFDGDGGYWAYVGPDFRDEILDYESILAIRNAGMDGHMLFSGSYAYDHYTRKSWAKATVTCSSECVASCVMTEDDYIEYNVGAHVVQHEAVGAGYKLYMIGEHLIDIAQTYRRLGIQSDLLAPFMSDDAYALVLVLSEIYETMLGGFSVEALELFQEYLEPPIRKGEVINFSRLGEFRELLERYGANSNRAAEILSLLNVLALIISSEKTGMAPQHYTQHRFDGLALAAAHFTFEIGRGRFHGFTGAFSPRGRLANNMQARGQHAVMLHFFESLMTGLIEERELFDRLTRESSVLGCGRTLFRLLYVELGLTGYTWLGNNPTRLQWTAEFFAQFGCTIDPDSAPPAATTPQPQPLPPAPDAPHSTPTQAAVVAAPQAQPEGAAPETIAYTEMSLTPSQQRAFDAFAEGSNIMICGQAGTGKSYLCEEIERFSVERQYKVVKTGSTGTSAQNIRAAGTFNSVLGLGLGFSGIGLSGKEADQIMSRARRSRVREEHLTINSDQKGIVMIVDEVSMLDTRLLSIGAQAAAQAGVKIQWVLIGDPGQCTPPKGELFFKPFRLDYPNGAQSYNSFLESGNFRCVSLKEVVRQANDQAFLRDLQLLRSKGTPGPVIIERYKASVQAQPEDAIHTYFNNEDVLRHNRAGTEALIAAGATPRTYKARVKLIQANAQQWPRQFDPIEEQMVLCVGMPIMIRKNLKEGGRLVAANGSTGIVLECLTNSIRVRLKNGNELLVEAQELDGPKDGKGKPLAEYIQLPLHPAFAVTGHKLQGLTLSEPLVVHPYQNYKGQRRAVTTPGWLYVVCSRVTESKYLYFAMDPEPTQVINWLLAGNRVDREAMSWLESIE